MLNPLGLEQNSRAAGGSDRGFGVMFGVIFLLLAGLFRLRGQSDSRQIALMVLSATIFGVAFGFPKLLRPFNRFWAGLSRFLSRIVSPIVLGVLFYFVISPLAVVLRLSGRDELRLKLRPTTSHWRNRNIKGYSLESFQNQY